MKKVKTVRTQAQIERDKRNDQRRKTMARFPTARLNTDEEKLMNTLYKMHNGEKKKAVLAAVDFYVSKKK